MHVHSVDFVTSAVILFYWQAQNIVKDKIHLRGLVSVITERDLEFPWSIFFHEAWHKKIIIHNNNKQLAHDFSNVLPM